MEDLRDFHVKVEPPQQGSYKGIDVYTCGFWCQGPALIQVLQILEGLDVGEMGLNSPDYLHAVLEAINLDDVKSNGYSFQIEMSFRAFRKGFKIKEIPIVFVDRQAGMSKMSKKIVREAIWMVWRLRIMAMMGQL